MAHTLAAVFDNRADAEKARDQLAGAGFDRAAIRLNDSSSDYADARATSSSGATAAASTDRDSGGFMDSVRNFFADLFGDDSDDRHVYSEAVNRGNVVLTLITQTQVEVERAADIVEACGPIDIDEQRSQWQGEGWTASQPVRSAGQRQTSSGALQSGQSAPQSGGKGSRQFTQQASAQGQAGQQQRAIPVVEEQLNVGKRLVERGGVRIFQHVRETPVDETVSLREEHVRVERHKVDRPVDPDAIEAFKETSFELRESAEEAVVQKTARVVEEVVVGKEQTAREEHIHDTLRKTDVEIQQLGKDDDRAFRSHWKSNFATSGRSYDEYAPAYQYGYSMRRGDSYRNRSWDDSETELRRDWESRYPGSAWENFKAAIRHGWDRLTD
jgi:uncharacterized protein (TIGR02271 family)